MNSAFRNILTIYKRELAGHFNSILAYVLIFVFALLSMAMGFVLGAFLDRGDASLASSFLMWHPWLFLLIGPALGMRLWSEEHRTGTIELLLTMPVTPWQAILAKFLASCTVILAALAMTFPVVITVCYLGDPDVGAIFTGYVASFLVASSMVAIACVVSAFTRSLVACLVVSFAICFILTLIGFDPITQAISDLWGGTFAEAVSRLSLMSHFQDMTRGVIYLNNIVYFASLIGFCLFVTSVVIRSKRS